MDSGPDAAGLPADGDRQRLARRFGAAGRRSRRDSLCTPRAADTASACHAGLVAATAPLIAVMDADASLDPAQLPDLIDPLVRVMRISSSGYAG